MKRGCILQIGQVILRIRDMGGVSELPVVPELTYYPTLSLDEFKQLTGLEVFIRDPNLQTLTEAEFVAMCDRESHG